MTTRRKNVNQLAPSCRRKVIETKIRQTLLFDFGGCSGHLCGCLILGGRRELLRGRVRLGCRDGIWNWSVFCPMEGCIILFQEGQTIRHTLLRYIGISPRPELTRTDDRSKLDGTRLWKLQGKNGWQRTP